MRELRRTRSRQQLAVLRPVRGAAQRRAAGDTAGAADLPGLRGDCLRQESPVLRCLRRIALKKGLPCLRDSGSCLALKVLHPVRRDIYTGYSGYPGRGRPDVTSFRTYSTTFT